MSRRTVRNEFLIYNIIRIFTCLFSLSLVVFLIVSKAMEANPPAWVREFPLVKVEGRQLVVDYDKDGHYEPYFIKGVVYHPMPIGRYPNDGGWRDPEGLKIDNIFDDEFLLRRDFDLLQAMNANTIRIWQANRTSSSNENSNRLTIRTLDLSREYGIKVIAGFWVDTSKPRCENGRKVFHPPNFRDPKVREDYIRRFVQFVNTFKDHPAILFWAIGNENNYHLNENNFEQMEAWYTLANRMAQAAHAVEGDRYHPVAIVNGDIANIGELIYGTNDVNLESVDIWGANVYRGKSFGDLFKNYKTKSNKPLWISEFGVDAFYAPDYRVSERGYEDQETQAQWIGALWDEISSHKAITIGGTVMEYSDEWWKPDERMNNGIYNASQNYFGDGPADHNCDGYLDWYPAAPDKFYHQEWWGIMSVNSSYSGLDVMTPRSAYYILRDKFKMINKR